jgi:galactose mutarotase-like enzyme
MKRAAGFLLLQHQATRLTLDPTRGGAIRELTWRCQDILRRTRVSAGDDPFDMACFPMVPFVNRVARGRFTFGGRTVQLERNCSFLHVYAPAGRGFFCIEPQSASAGALGRDAAQATVVPPGGRFAIRVQFMVGAS